MIDPLVLNHRDIRERGGRLDIDRWIRFLVCDRIVRRHQLVFVDAIFFVIDRVLVDQGDFFGPTLLEILAIEIADACAPFAVGQVLLRRLAVPDHLHVVDALIDDSPVKFRSVVHSDFNPTHAGDHAIENRSRVLFFAVAHVLCGANRVSG